MAKEANSFQETFSDIFGDVLSGKDAPKPDVIARVDNAGGAKKTPSRSVDQAELEQMFLALKRQFVERDERLKKLTEGALIYAVIVSVFTPKKGEKKDLAPGDRVEVVSGAQKGKQGLLISLTKGGPVVDFGEPQMSRFADLAMLAPVVSRRAVILLDGKKFEVAFPAQLDVASGDAVTISRESLQIVGRAELVLKEAGSIVVLTKVLDATTSEVLVDGHPALVYNGMHTDLVAGARVVLDSSRHMIVENLGTPDFESFGGPSKPVEWDDIGGNDEAKDALKDAIELPTTAEEYFRHYNKKPPNGIVLIGPPGCGKTLLGRAAATAQARVHGRSLADGGFFYIEGPEFLSKFVGVAEADIRNLFDVARKFRETHGYKPIICLDEAEALLSKRGSGISSDIEKTVVPTFLAQMQGVDECPAIVLLFTNRPDVLDPAVTRPGRIDRIINVSRPDRNASKTIFGIHLRKVPLVGMTQEAAVEAVVNELFSPDRALYEVSVGRDPDDSASKDTTMRFCLGDLASGAMIENIVELAALSALRRDFKGNKKTGVTLDDLKGAVANAFKRNELLNQSDDLEVFVEKVKERVTGLKKLKQGSA